MSSELEAILRVILLSLFLERALSMVFEHRWVVVHLDRWRGWKEPIAFLAAFLACWYWGLDALGEIFGRKDPSLWGYALTAAVVAGGSKVSVALFRDYLDVRSRFSRQFEQERAERIRHSRESAGSILRLQDYLTRYGYLERPSGASFSDPVLTSPSVIPGTLDESTQAAVRVLQRRLDEPLTGIPGDALLTAIRHPRCAASDAGLGPSQQPSWGSQRSLRYAIGPSLPTLIHDGELDPQALAPGRSAEERCADAIERAFATWESALAVQQWRFVQVAPGSESDIRVSWIDPPDPCGLMGALDVGHAESPGLQKPLDIHLDRSKSWSDSGRDYCYDIETVVLHEIGHCLGRLGHNEAPAAVMNEAIGTGTAGVKRQLHAQDIRDIMEIYS